MARDDEFVRFVTDRYRDLVGLARQLSRDDRSNAEDVVQEALVKTAARWDSVDDPFAYARTAVIRASVDRHRWLTRRFGVVRDPDVEAAESGHDLAGLLTDRVSLMTAMRQLPALAQQVLVLRYYEGLTEQEVAQLTGRPLGTVKSAAHRGLRRLEELLGPSDSPAEENDHARS